MSAGGGVCGNAPLHRVAAAWLSYARLLPYSLRADSGLGLGGGNLKLGTMHCCSGVRCAAARCRAVWTALVAGLILGSSLAAQTLYRTELAFPDLPGFVTLRCDFHLHTAFSDGRVWPDLRVAEAWRDGLDVIALTDHLEYLPHKADLPVNYARPYEIARAEAKPLGLVVIRGAEITRGEPPGHLNALFLTNVAALDQKDYRVAVSNAFVQGAFLFWCHPGWQQPGHKAVWYAEQGEFLTKGWLRGLEIVNGSDYEPIPHQWALDKQLAILGNSDEHYPITMSYSMQAGDYRPVTLVFTKDRSPASIHEALLARRTSVFSAGRLFGEEKYLAPLFRESLKTLNPELRFRGKARVLLQVRNRAPLNFQLRFDSSVPGLRLPHEATLAAGKVSTAALDSMSGQASGERELEIPCTVLNLLVAPDKPLTTTLQLKVKFEQSTK